MNQILVPRADDAENTAPTSARPGARWVDVRVELVHHRGCRFAQATHELLQECLTTLAIPAPVLVRVADHPSPTVLINGIDVMGASPDQLTASACRLDIPTREHILTVLTAQLTAESTE